MVEKGMDRRLFLLSLFLLLAALPGCRDLSVTTTAVRVRAPRMPVHWDAAFGSGEFVVSWAASGAVSSGEIHLQPLESTIISVPRDPPVVVQAQPVFPRARLAAAGAVWPLHLQEDGVLDLSFEHGAAALVLFQAARGGADLRSFAVRRFTETVSERFADDPWQIDVDALVWAIINRSMRESYIRAVDQFPVVAPVPAGRWYPVSPFAQPVTAETGWPALPKGLSRFTGTGGERLFVEIDEQGRSWVSVP